MYRHPTKRSSYNYHRSTRSHAPFKHTASLTQRARIPHFSLHSSHILPRRCTRHSHFAAVITTPSYSLEAMYSRVRSKCLLGPSIVAASWLVWRLEWMSSMRPLMYLIVT